MIHGGRDPSVRPAAQRDAIDALHTADRIDRGMAAQLAQTYRLLRTVEHRVQMVEDSQIRLLPASPAALANVAQLHGFGSRAELLNQLRPHVEQAGRILDSLSPDERSVLSNDPDILK